MRARVMPKRKNGTQDVQLTLTVEEAIALEAVIGGMTGALARELPWYDRIADVLENSDAIPSTISQAVEQRFGYFHVEPTFYDGEDFSTDRFREIRKSKS